jgi:hypothetical protein
MDNFKTKKQKRGVQAYDEVIIILDKETSWMQKPLHHFLYQDNRVHYAWSQSQEFSMSQAPEKHNDKDQTNLYN